jgi:predicted RNase H-like nuclease (RuvC/YqgF family)
MFRPCRWPIIVSVKAQPADEYTVLCDEIRELLDGPVAAPEQSLEQLEDTLTEGYARALALEAERLRLERKIGELGADVRRGAERSGDEIASLAAHLSHASSRLDGLRALLAALRRRAMAARTIAPLGS